jgi:hypothetical protein
MTALLGILAIGLSGAQEPAQFTIETKVYEIESKSFAIHGKSMKSNNPKIAPNSLGITTAIGVDEKKLAQSKGIKLISAPVIRTLDGMKAELTLESKDIGEKVVSSKVSFIPVLRTGPSVELSMTVGLDRQGEPREAWNHTEKPTLKSGEPYALLIISPASKRLYLVKAHFGE